jgi:hypothetical protein
MISVERSTEINRERWQRKQATLTPGTASDYLAFRHTSAVRGLLSLHRLFVV